MENIDHLRKKYYEVIILLQDEEDILNALPRSDYGNFFPIITGLIRRLEEELLYLENQLKSLDQFDYDMKEYIQEEIKTVLFKREVCNNLLQKEIEDKIIEEEAEKTPAKNIIFATTNSGNVCIRNDIKTFPEEYYESIISSLQNLSNGIEENNSEKAKALKTVNKKMAKIHEIKEFKVRLFYKNLSADTVYVLMVRMKKSDNDALDRKEVIIRDNQMTKQFNQLKKIIKDSEVKQKLIFENQEILSDLYDFLIQNKRGK